MRGDDEKWLEAREAAALARVRAAAAELELAIVRAGVRVSREHPWALPSLGFCAGFLAPFLVPDLRPGPEDNGHESRR